MQTILQCGDKVRLRADSDFYMSSCQIQSDGYVTVSDIPQYDNDCCIWVKELNPPFRHKNYRLIDLEVV